MSSPLSIIHTQVKYTPQAHLGGFFFFGVDLAESKPLTLLSKQVIFLDPYSYYPSSILKQTKKKKKFGLDFNSHLLNANNASQLDYK